RLGLVALVVEAHWSKRKDRFTALAHGFNVLLVAHRGGGGTKLVVRANDYVQSDGANGSTADTAEPDSRGSTSYGPVAGADAGRSGFQRRGGYVVADIDVIVTYEGGVGPRSETQNDVAAGTGHTKHGAETQSRSVARGGT